MDINTFKSTTINKLSSFNTFKALLVDINTLKSNVDLATTSIKSNIKNTIVFTNGYYFVLQEGSPLAPITSDYIP